MTNRLTDKDLAFHQKVVAQAQAAQAAYNTWMAYLSYIYDLTEHDGVQGDGKIVRAPSTTPGSD